MSIHITTAMVKQYDVNVQLLSQQMESRFQAAVRNEPINAEEGFYDQISATEATKRTTRHADTTYTNTPHMRRRVLHYPWDWADLIDRADQVNILTDPSGKYAMNAVAAMNRAKDAEIIEAAEGTAYGGKAGATAYSITKTVAVDLSGSNEGLTLNKLISAKIQLLQGELLPRGEKLYFAYRAAQLENMLKVEKLTSGDYASVKALIEGEINYFMGFNWIHSELLTNVASTDITTCIAWAETGLLLATAEEITTKIDRMPSKNQSIQVWAGMDIGATRMEEDKVVLVYCDESP